MISKVSIIIPTHKRPRQLTRLLDYYSNYDYPIYVVDSSPQKFQDLKRFGKVRYFYYKNWPYAKKLAVVYPKIKTKYVVFCGDDDFITNEGIKTCVKFLEKHPNYSSAHGHYLYFEDQKKSGVKIEPWYLYSIGAAINSSTPSERLNQLMNHYMQLLYSTTRTKDVREAFNYIKKHKEITNDNLIELLQAIVLCINGKSKILPVLYAIRERTPGSAGTYVDDLETISTKDIYLQQYSKWCKIIILHLVKKQKISLEEAEKEVRKAVNAYLKPILYQNSFIQFDLKRLKREINRLTFGLAVKIRDLTITPENRYNLKKHAYFTKNGDKVFQEVNKYIVKYHV